MTDDDTSANASTSRGTAAIAVEAMAVEAVVEDGAWLQAIPGAAATARRACLAALAETRRSAPLAVALLLADDARLRTLNRRWRGIDRATDVLSFPSARRHPGQPLLPPPGQAPGEAIALGDVALARETVLADAAAAAKPPQSHLAHLVVHGVLHLLGYDHVRADDARLMAAAEGAILARLGLPAPPPPP